MNAARVCISHGGSHLSLLFFFPGHGWKRYFVCPTSHLPYRVHITHTRTPSNPHRPYIYIYIRAIVFALLLAPGSPSFFFPALHQQREYHHLYALGWRYKKRCASILITMVPESRDYDAARGAIVRGREKFLTWRCCCIDPARMLLFVRSLSLVCM